MQGVWLTGDLANHNDFLSDKQARQESMYYCQLLYESYVLKAWNKHEWASDGILFQPSQNSVKVNLLSCLICLSGVTIGQIACQSSSLRRIIKYRSSLLLQIYKMLVDLRNTNELLFSTSEAHTVLIMVYIACE